MCGEEVIIHNLNISVKDCKNGYIVSKSWSDKNNSYNSEDMIAVGLEEAIELINAELTKYKEAK